MAYLTEKEKSILFAAIHREENVCKEHGYDDLVQVCKRLTHLFSYNRFEKEIRNKVVNEFAEKLSQEFIRTDEDGNLYIFAWITDFREIAEKMKGE